MQFLPDPAGWFGVKDGEDSVRQSSSAALSIPSDTKRTRNVVDDVQKYQGRPTCLRSRVGSHKASEIHHAAPLLGAQPAIGPYCDVLALYRNLHLNDYVYAVSDTVGDASMASWIARGGGNSVEGNTLAAGVDSGGGSGSAWLHAVPKSMCLYFIL
jgi:hypothetical protein